MNNNNHIKKQFSINNNTINLSSLDNTLKTISGNRTFNLGKKSYDAKNKNNLNTKYEHLNTYNNQSLNKETTLRKLECIYFLEGEKYVFVASCL